MKTINNCVRPIIWYKWKFTHFSHTHTHTHTQRNRCALQTCSFLFSSNNRIFIILYSNYSLKRALINLRRWRKISPSRWQKKKSSRGDGLWRSSSWRDWKRRRNEPRHGEENKEVYHLARYGYLLHRKFVVIELVIIWFFFFLSLLYPFASLLFSLPDSIFLRITVFCILFLFLALW